MVKKLPTQTEHKNICQKLNVLRTKRQWIQIRRCNYYLELQSAAKVLDQFKNLLDGFGIFQQHFPHQFDMRKLDEAMAEGGSR